MNGHLAGIVQNWFKAFCGSLTLNSDGTISMVTDLGGNSSNWFWPTTGGIGASYWYRATVIGTTGSVSNTSPASGVWRALSPSAAINAGAGAGGVECLIEIAADAAGANVVWRGRISVNNTI